MEGDSPAQATYNHMLDLYVKPEIERRAREGLLDTPLALHKFQVVLRDDGPPEVRLNDEVMAIAKLRLTANRDINKGDPIFEDDVDEIASIRLTDRDNPDSAHVTCFILRGEANLYFDFRYNKALARKHLDTAQEFMESAAEALEADRMAAFVDNLLSATELTARAVLLTMPDKRFRKKASHKVIHDRYADFVQLGNADAEQSEVYGELRRLRDAKRYVTADPPIDRVKAQRFLEVIQLMYGDASSFVG